MNTSSLYALIKHYSGLSPKELAFDLGFNDPEYFSRLFKKETGTTITVFVQDLTGK